MENTTKKHSFIKGAALLGITGVIVKVLGMVFRIPVLNWIGEEGGAYYGVAYPVYSLLLVVATAGLPVAISRMVSQRTALGKYAAADRVFSIARLLMLGIGIVSFAICFFGADAIAHSVNIPGAAPSLRTIAPALLFVPIVSSFRGYFQGQQIMVPTALSELVEQSFRVVVGLILAYYFAKTADDMVSASAGATFGASAGSMMALALMIFIYWLNKDKIKRRAKNSVAEDESSKEIIKQILLIAIPITIGAAIFPLMSTIDAWMVPNRLISAGYSSSQAENLYGVMSSFCSSLIGFPQVFTQAVAISLVPAIAAAYERQEKLEVQNNIKLGTRVTLIMGFPCAVGIFVLAEPILNLLYPLQPEACATGAPTIMVMSIGIIFLSTIQTLTGALQGIGKQLIPVKNLAIGALAKIVVTYFATGIYALNIKGAALGTLATYIIATVLNIKDIYKYTGTKFDFMQTYIKPFAASVIMGIFVFASHWGLTMILPGAVATLASILIGVIVYLVLVLLIKAITRDELLVIPMGGKLVKILDKVWK
ncbi:MAG: polysaccharide biosynthesis protein [Clostridia bacterium]|nr:polysaccharide biosynthesis protein [Clostridia bacterium]